jgi:hypothetical protein
MTGEAHARSRRVSGGDPPHHRFYREYDALAMQESSDRNIGPAMLRNEEPGGSAANFNFVAIGTEAANVVDRVFAQTARTWA